MLYSALMSFSTMDTDAFQGDAMQHRVMQDLLREGYFAAASTSRPSIYLLTVKGSVLANKIKVAKSVDKVTRARSSWSLHNYKIHWVLGTVEPDGNCLFRACSSVIFGHERNHFLLRMFAMTFIKENFSLFHRLFQELREPEHADADRPAFRNWIAKIEQLKQL